MNDELSMLIKRVRAGLLNDNRQATADDLAAMRDAAMLFEKRYAELQKDRDELARLLDVSAASKSRLKREAIYTRQCPICGNKTEG